jgi:GT2 family glycosyltransferase
MLKIAQQSPISATPQAAPENNTPAWLQAPETDPVVDVSVCIANWNCKEVLRNCLESLNDIPQGVRMETIVVDNHSIDGADAMVASDFPEVVLVRNSENRGFAKASNQAARRSAGQYLFFLNNDTVVPAYTLRRLMDYVRRHPQVGMIGPRLRDATGRFQISYRNKPTVAALLHRTALFRWTRLFAGTYRRYRRQRFDPAYEGPVQLLMGAAVFMPRKVFFECGGWDEDFAFGGEDLELAARVGAHYPVYFVPSVEITHFGRISSRQNNDFCTESVAIGYVQYLRKSCASRAGILFYKLAVTLDLPLQLIGTFTQYVLRRASGRRDKAQKSLLALRGLVYFAGHSVGKFWRA